jgi:hypothetical protein
LPLNRRHSSLCISVEIGTSTEERTVGVLLEEEAVLLLVLLEEEAEARENKPLFSLESFFAAFDGGLFVPPFLFSSEQKAFLCVSFLGTMSARN